MVSIELLFAIQEAMAAGERWQETNDPAALSTLIEAWEGIFTSPFFFQLDRGQQAQFFSMAGDAAQRRYRADRKIEDLDRALKWFRQSVECLPPEAENPSSYLVLAENAHPPEIRPGRLALGRESGYRCPGGSCDWCSAACPKLVMAHSGRNSGGFSASCLSRAERLNIRFGQDRGR